MVYVGRAGVGKRFPYIVKNVNRIGELCMKWEMMLFLYLPTGTVIVVFLLAKNMLPMTIGIEKNKV